MSGLFVTSAVALAALLASYLAVYAERWAVSFLSAPDDADLRAAVRVMAAGAAHSAMLTQAFRPAPSRIQRGALMKYIFARLGRAAGGVLGLVLPVAQRHEFRLRHA